MLFPTHRRFGVFLGLALSVAIVINMYNFTLTKTIFGLIVAIILAMSGAVFGAEFPDIDSPGSIPRRHHPLWGIGFDFFHVHHRGKFSHSLLSQTLFWGAIIIGTYLVGAGKILIPTQYRHYLPLAFKLFLTFALSTQLTMIASAIDALAKSKIETPAGILNVLLFIMTDDPEYSKKARYRKPNQKQMDGIKIASLLFSALVFFIVFANKGFSLKDYANFLIIYLIGTYVGVLSHWFADSITLQGVKLGWEQGYLVSPAKAMMRNPILKHFVPNNEFRTGSSWETVIRIGISIGCIIAFVVLVYDFIHIAIFH